MTSDERTADLENRLRYLTEIEMSELYKRRFYNSMAEKAQFLPDYFTESEGNMNKAIFMALLSIRDTIETVCNEISNDICRLS
jgi:hypothetical protein